MKEKCTYFLSQLYDFQTKEYLYLTGAFEVVSLLLSLNEDATVAYLNEVTKEEDIVILCRMFDGVQFLGGQEAYRKALVALIERFKDSQHSVLIARYIGYGIERIDNRNKNFNS